MDSIGSTGSGSATGSGSTSGGGGAAAGTGTGSVSGQGGDGVVDFGTGGTGTGPDAGCFATVSKAEQTTTTVTTTQTVYKPFDMFIMYDQSGSMGDKTGNGSTKWDSIKAALTGFVNAPENKDIGVGIAYFPLSPPPCNATGPNCNCINLIITNLCIPTGGGSCTASDYAVPDVPMGLLPAVAPAIVTSIGNHSPGGGTPTAPALAGALQYAEPWAAAHPDRKTIVVLATDGDPTGCTGNAVQDVANIAAGGLSAQPPVQTFVIGVGSSLTSLNAIAAAGGTTQAFIVDATTGDPTQQFLDAMNKIRESVTVSQTHDVTVTKPVPCEWAIPPPPDGKTFDKTKVNLDYTIGMGTPTRVGNVATAADCANVDQGWYYDADPPTKVLVCPQTCSAVGGNQDAGVDAMVQVVFGCDMVKAKIR